jgi:hypothetical protein
VHGAELLYGVAAFHLWNVAKLSLVLLWLLLLLLQAWQAAQVELVLTNVKGAKGTPAEGKCFNITFK